MPDLPSGTVTFLFTDIEGSTTRWERHPQAMRQALARHDALLHKGITAHGGVVLTERGEGDSFFALFPRPSDALAAACALQRALVAESWPQEVAPLRVRIALHTGEAGMREGQDYRGAAVNRCARLRAVAHGGQVLLSGATYELVRDLLPLGVTLRDLGAHRLKDLTRAEPIFQVLHPELPAAFPPLKTLDRQRHNLPVQLTPFIGREREISAVRERLLDPLTRLLTLTGPGGTGKTRLAVQVAAEVLDTFADGVFFVNLAPLADPTLVLPTVTQTLGVLEGGGQALHETLAGSLREKQLLLVLDNFEQVLDAAPLVAEVLAACPLLKVLVTSRVALRVRGEREVPVPPLAVPDPSHLPALPVLSQYEAVRLFIARAQDVKPDFAVTNENAPAVADICVRLDGLPLAIELAAARIRLLPPHTLLTRLSSRLKILTGGARDLPARQQTLRATLDWSYSLLTEAERTLFARLGVFVGGGTLEASEAICTPDGDLDVLAGVEALIEKSLLREEDGGGGEPRFVMLETIHEYARERLEESGEADELQRRHAAYFLALVEEVEPELKGPRQGEWLGRLEQEHDNLRAALQWARAHGEVEHGLRLAGALYLFWYLRGHAAEGYAWLEDLLARVPADEVPVARRAKALNGAGTLAHYLGDYGYARARYEQSLTLRREMGDVQGVAASLNNLGLLTSEQGANDQAAALYEESLALARALGDPEGISITLNNLGDVARAEGNHARAAEAYRESLALAEARGDMAVMAEALTNLGDLARERGDVQQAEKRYTRSLVLLRGVDEGRLIALNLEGLAGVAGTQGHMACAARLFGTAAALREAIGAPVSPTDRARYERDVLIVRTALGNEALAREWAEGRALPLEQAIAYALEGDVHT